MTSSCPAYQRGEHSSSENTYDKIKELSAHNVLYSIYELEKYFITFRNWDLNTELREYEFFNTSKQYFKISLAALHWSTFLE